ncbi:hypothetical protein ME806_17660 [Lactobacillus delbrueckii]|nr:hypothetical protein ME806_17660 [Lactobacillus delbrueckii]
MDDLTCPDCQYELKEIGSFCARKELLYIPAQVKRIDHIQHSHKCQHCSDERHQLTRLLKHLYLRLR